MSVECRAPTCRRAGMVERRCVARPARVEVHRNGLRPVRSTAPGRTAPLAALQQTIRRAVSAQPALPSRGVRGRTVQSTRCRSPGVSIETVQTA